MRGRRVDIKLLAASLGIALGLVLIAMAFLRADLDGPGDDLPTAVESVQPVPGATQVLGQSQVIVDLATGFEGRLEIDGEQLATIPLDEVNRPNISPGEQIELPAGVVFEPGNATLTFTPGEDQPIERFESGVHEVRVVFWRTVDGPGTARSYHWSFTSL